MFSVDAESKEEATNIILVIWWWARRKNELCSSIIRGYYYLRIQSYTEKYFIPFSSSLYPPLLPTPPSLIATISNSEGLTFNILSCRGLWDRWHIFILSSLHENRMHTNTTCSSSWSRITVKRKITNDTNNYVCCKLLFIFVPQMDYTDKPFFHWLIWTCLTLKM